MPSRTATAQDQACGKVSSTDIKVLQPTHFLALNFFLLLLCLSSIPIPVALRHESLKESNNCDTIYFPTSSMSRSLAQPESIKEEAFLPIPASIPPGESSVLIDNCGGRSRLGRKAW